MTTKLKLCDDRWYRNVLLEEETQIFHLVLTTGDAGLLQKIELEFILKFTQKNRIYPYEIQGKIKTLKNSLQSMRKHVSSS